MCEVRCKEEKEGERSRINKFFFSHWLFTDVKWKTRASGNQWLTEELERTCSASDFNSALFYHPFTSRFWWRIQWPSGSQSPSDSEETANPCQSKHARSKKSPRWDKDGTVRFHAVAFKHLQNTLVRDKAPQSWPQKGHQQQANSKTSLQQQPSSIRHFHSWS